MIILKKKCPICGGVVGDDGVCEKCGVSYFKACETEHAKEFERISMFALIATAIAMIFS